MTISILPVIACLTPLAVGLLTLAVVKLCPPYRHVFGVSLTAYLGIAALAVFAPFFAPMTYNIRAGFVALSMMMIVLLLAVQLSLWARASEH